MPDESDGIIGWLKNYYPGRPGFAQRRNAYLQVTAVVAFRADEATRAFHFVADDPFK